MQFRSRSVCRLASLVNLPRNALTVEVAWRSALGGIVVLSGQRAFPPDREERAAVACKSAHNRCWDGAPASPNPEGPRVKTMVSLA